MSENYLYIEHLKETEVTVVYITSSPPFTTLEY